MKQHTVKSFSSLSGIALHSGVRASVKLCPAPENTGVVFRRVDLPGAPEVRALASNVVEVQRGTTIASGKAVVYTVEHILSALHAFAIDNCFVEMNGMEPPICDGSALAFADLIKEAGIEEQNQDAVSFTPSAPLAVTYHGTKIAIIPDPDKLTISCVTSFKGCPVDPQYYEFAIQQGIAADTEDYLQNIAPGRTFVDYKDLNMLFSMGLCKGGSLDAAAIIHDGAIICRDGLRFQNEIVRHKILDIIGDLYLAGCRITGQVIAVKPGHPFNVALAGKLQQEIVATQQS